MKLTETSLKSLKTPTTAQLVSDDLTTGLYLKLYTSGRKSWIYRARKHGAWEVVTLGSWPDMNLALARKKATAMGERTSSGNMTFAELLDEWFAARIENRYKVTANIQTYVARGKDWLGSKQLSQLTTMVMADKLKAYAKVSPVSANRCLSNWKLALDFGVESGYMDTNPLARTTSKVVGGEEKTRDRVLTDAEIRTVWAWEGHNASLLRFLLLTGLRISEAQQGRQDGTLWRVDTTKNGKAHWCHLPTLAAAQIEPWTTSPTAVQAWLQRQCAREGVAPFTPHDCRRTFATRLAGLKVAPHIVEKCLNHSMQGVMGIYNRETYDDDRIAAAELWANELQTLVSLD